MRGRAKPSSFMASLPSSMVRAMRAGVEIAGVGGGRRGWRRGRWQSRSQASSMRDSVRAAELRDVFGVAGERASGKRDGLFIQRRGDHGVGLAAQAHFGGDPDVVHGGGAAARVEFAEGEAGHIFQASRMSWSSRVGERAPPFRERARPPPRSNGPGGRRRDRPAL